MFEGRLGLPVGLTGSPRVTLGTVTFSQVEQVLDTRMGWVQTQN